MKKLWRLLLASLLLCACSVTHEVKLEEAYSYAQQYEGYTYYRDMLSGIDQDAYDVFYYHIANMDTDFTLQSVNDDTFLMVIDYVIKDHPELFWYDAMDVSYIVREQKSANLYNIHAELKKDATLIQQQKETIQQNTSEVIAHMNSLSSDYEKAKYAYDYIIDLTDYDEESEDNQNIVSVFINQDSVCAGYAKAFQYLMNACNIPCVYMTGGTKYSKDNHAWNMVQLDGSYYYMDATNGDYSSETIDQRIRYAYFAMDTSQMLQLYTPDNLYEFSDAKEDNYFVKEQLYLEDSSMDSIQAIMDRSVQDETQRGVLFQCSVKDVCTRLSQKLELQDTIFHMLDQAGYHAEQYQNVIMPETNVYLYSYK